MENYFIVALVTFAVFACSPSHSFTGEGITTIEKYPSLAHVDFLRDVYWYRSCAASILTNLHVLSSVRCFSGLGYNPSHRRIRMGTSQSNNGGWISYVRRSINHPYYGLNGYDNDITVVSLLNRLTFGPTVRRASLIPQGFIIPKDEDLIHAGWTFHGSQLSMNVREVSVKLLNQEHCQEQYILPTSPSNVTDNMLCTTFVKYDPYFCQNDLGGPIYYKGMVAGIVSWRGEGCISETNPGVNTAVSSYTDWVVSVAV